MFPLVARGGFSSSRATAGVTSSICTIVLEQTERTRQSSKADIEQLIEKTQLKIASLQSQIERERAIAAALRYIISPVRALPVELLAEIFVLAIRDCTHITDVLRLSQVCSDWRQVAHSTPRLWTGPIRVNLSHKKSDLGEVYAEGLKAWLARSAPHLVQCVSLVQCPTEDPRSRILAEVLKTSARWRNLDLVSTPLWLAIRVAECKWDSLDELFLGIMGPNTSHLDSLSFTVPRLRKLDINIRSNDPHILMPWAQLTDLHLDSDYPDSALDIIVQCADLVKAVFSICGWRKLPKARRDNHILSRLRSLALVFFGSAGYVAPFLDCISAPVLEELCFDFEYMDGRIDWAAAHLPAFQMRAPNLARLDLRHTTLQPVDLVDILRCAPALTHLKLSSCRDCFDDTLIRSLHYKKGVKPLVPRLHNLILQDIFEIFTPKILADMLTSRWWTNAELKSFSAPPAVARWTLFHVQGDHCSENFADIMEGLQNNGLPIEFYTI
ncbi:hypothetical protein DFH08DRAFT_763788 [Mycena albidolilacea]|uniref:F-box domain-containing protein n=1 Tax=Mycena albidolilacea TaxID=1033008 RepID=A0AAD7F5D2_9AGAR|nr:hypothetical protein DFH08DRAFT_763788 [Mycena albidolilacea]